MAMNRVQFQKGLSLPEFIQRFGTEEQCATALETARWLGAAEREDVVMGAARKRHAQ